MLSTSGLKFSYEGKKLLTFPDILCKRGEPLLLLGQSGSGKTTFLHLVAGLLKPLDGKVTIDGTAIHELTTSGLDRFRGKKIGIVFQKSHFIQSLTVEENLLLARNLAGEKEDKKRIFQFAERLNLSEKLNARPANLSQGEQQRAAILRAIINYPAIILADEPTSALDDLHTSSVTELLTEQAAAVNAALLIVTHDNRLKEVFPNRISL